MRQRLYFTLFTLIALLTGASASTISVGDVTVPVGGQAEVVVGCDLNSDYYGFQIETPLAAGIDVVGCSAGNSAANYTVEHAKLSTGIWRFIGYDVQHRAMATGKGELLRFTISASSTLAAGTYPVTITYAELTDQSGRAVTIGAMRFNIIVTSGQGGATLADISSLLDKLRQEYDAREALYKQLDGCLPFSDYNTVMTALRKYGTELSDLEARYVYLYETSSVSSSADIAALSNDVKDFATRMTVGLAQLDETVKSMAAKDLLARLTGTGKDITALSEGCAELEAQRLKMASTTGKYYFERILTESFSAALSTAKTRISTYGASVDSLANVYNTLVAQNSISTVQTAIDFYKKYFGMADGYKSVSARTAAVEALISALKGQYDQLAVRFPDPDLYYSIRPTGIKEDIQVGYKSNRGFVLTSAGMMRFEQVNGNTFRLVNFSGEYMTPSTAGLTAGTAEKAALWEGVSLGDGNYTFRQTDNSSYLAYGGGKVNAPVNTSAKAYAWTIEESELDELQAMLNLLAEENDNKNTEETQAVRDTLYYPAPKPCVTCTDSTPIVFPSVPYIIYVFGPNPLPIPSPNGGRTENDHPIHITKGSHVVIDNMTLKDLIGGHHVIYVEGILEITIKVKVLIENWQWFIKVGPTGRVIWRGDSDKSGKIWNIGTLEIEDGNLGSIQNEGKVIHHDGTVNHVDNQGEYEMSGGYIENTESNFKETLFINRGIFRFIGGYIRGWCSRLIYHAQGATLRIDGGRFGFGHVRDYFIEAHDDFYIRGDYDYTSTVPILLRPSVTIHLLYQWIYKFNIVFIDGLPTPRYPLFRSEGFTLTTDHFRYINWTLPNHRWYWHYTVEDNTIEPRDGEVWDEEDLVYYINWLKIYKDSEATSSESNPQVLDLGGREIIITQPIEWPEGSHVVIRNGRLITSTSWSYEYVFRIPSGSWVRLEDVTIDWSQRYYYLVGGNVVMRHIFDVEGILYIGLGSHIIGWTDSNLTATDSYIPGAAICATGSGRIYLCGGWLDGVVLRITSTLNVYITSALTSTLYVYIPTALRYKGFRFIAPFGYSFTESDAWHIFKFFTSEWGIGADSEGYAYLEDPALLGIGELTTDGTDDGDYYNVQGIRTDKPRRGIYIRNGKKVVVK